VKAPDAPVLNIEAFKETLPPPAPETVAYCSDFEGGLQKDQQTASVSTGARAAQSNPWIDLLSDAADIISETIPPLVEVISGLVGERSKLVIGSGSKSFKTCLTVDAAMSIAHGTPFLERSTIRTRVLYCNLELKPETFKRRVQIIAKAKGIAVERAWFLHLPLRGELGGFKDVEGVVSRIIQVAQHCGAGVVVCDPVYKLNIAGDENSSRDQTVFFNQLDRITTEGGCTLILNDHFGKGNQSEKDPLDAIRGSSAKGGDLDAAMVMRRHDVEDCFRVDVVHRELPPVAPFCIGWKFPLMELRADLDPDNMKKVKGGRLRGHDPRKLLAVIAERDANKPISVSQWANAAGLARQTLTDYLPEMRRQGWIATVGEGNNARQYVTEKGRKIIEEGGY
jgi:predicted transcriptional regulator